MIERIREDTLNLMTIAGLSGHENQVRNYIKEKRDKIFKIMTENDYKRVFENLSHWDDWYVRKDNTVLKSMIDYK